MALMNPSVLCGRQKMEFKARGQVSDLSMDHGNFVTQQLCCSGCEYSFACFVHLGLSKALLLCSPLA